LKAHQNTSSRNAPSAHPVEEREVIVEALSTLAPNQREPVYLHHVMGMSFAEIGSVLGIRANTAKVRAHRGLAHLKKRINSDSRKDHGE
jgi:RNA polymerase sigma-70 factor (ECF subfamily)